MKNKLKHIGRYLRNLKTILLSFFEVGFTRNNGVPYTSHECYKSQVHKNQMNP